MSFESSPNGALPSNELSGWYDSRIEGPYEGDYLDPEYITRFNKTIEQLNLSVGGSAPLEPQKES
jgi:hypothetical protein